MKNWGCPRGSLYSLVERGEHKWVVIVITINICNRPLVAEIQYNAEIDLPFSRVFISSIFELTDICNPFLIELVSMEFPVQYVFRYIGWI